MDSPSLHKMQNKLEALRECKPLPRPEMHQHLITCSFCHFQQVYRISSKSVQNFLSYPADKQTDRQTNAAENITSLAEE